jgi:Leucine-rich repeat (LRR) protein
MDTKNKYHENTFIKWWNNLDKTSQDVIKIEIELSPEEKKQRNIWKNPYENYEAIRGKSFDSSNISIPKIEDIMLVRKFDCYGTKISEMPILSEFIKLNELYIGGTNIKELSEIENSPNIEKMCLYNAPINDLSPVAKLKNLKRICCSNTEVSDISALSDLDKLEVIIFYNTQVSSLSPLSKLKNLKRIRCHNTRISSQEITEFKNKNPSCEVFTDEESFENEFDDFTQ